VVLGALLLYGCTAAVERMVGDTRGHQARGWVVVQPARVGAVIAARHPDARAEEMAAELARRTRFGLIVTTDEVRQRTEAYEQRVVEVARGRLAFYAEIHELCRDAHLRAHPGAPRVETRVEPAETAAEAAPAGFRRQPERALHIGLSGPSRRDWNEMSAAVLADFLTQAAALPATR
jgi:hypothetical protein